MHSSVRLATEQCARRGTGRYCLHSATLSEGHSTIPPLILPLSCIVTPSPPHSSFHSLGLHDCVLSVLVTATKPGGQKQTFTVLSLPGRPVLHRPLPHGLLRQGDQGSVEREREARFRVWEDAQRCSG